MIDKRKLAKSLGETEELLDYIENPTEEEYRRTAKRVGTTEEMIKFINEGGNYTAKKLGTTKEALAFLDYQPILTKQLILSFKPNEIEEFDTKFSNFDIDFNNAIADAMKNKFNVEEYPVIEGGLLFLLGHLEQYKQEDIYVYEGYYKNINVQDPIFIISKGEYGLNKNIYTELEKEYLEGLWKEKEFTIVIPNASSLIADLEQFIEDYFDKLDPDNEQQFTESDIEYLIYSVLLASEYELVDKVRDVFIHVFVQDFELEL